MADTEPESPLVRQLKRTHGKEEQRPHHRALLLYAMQDPMLCRKQKRNVRAVARATGRGESTLRRWRSAKKWDERCDHDTAQLEAIELYRELYFHKVGNGELAVIEPLMSVPVLPSDTPKEPGGMGPAERLLRQQGLDRSDVEREVKRNLVMVQEALGIAADRIRKKDKGMRLRVRDIPLFMELEQQLLDRLAPAPIADQGRQVQRLAVVVDAEAKGEDLLQALHQGAQELAAVTEALLARRAAGVEAEVVHLALVPDLAEGAEAGVEGA